MALKDLCTEEKADHGIEIELFHPSTGDALGIVIGMLGSDSQAYLVADRKIKSRNLALAKKRRDLTAGMDPEIIEANQTERMKACFLYWKEKRADGTLKETVEFEEGVELPGTKDEFGKIIARRGFFWLRNQVAEEMDKVANFLPPAPKRSTTPPSSVSVTTDPARTE